MLLASPDIPKHYFKNAFMGSLIGGFGPHANRQHTEEILKDFNVCNYKFIKSIKFALSFRFTKFFIFLLLAYFYI